MTEEPEFDREGVLDLLGRPVNASLEECQHPWGNSTLSPTLDTPFMRLWDGVSGSPLLKNDRMFARLRRQSLDTREDRVEYLKIHADYQRWEPTPFISFTDSEVTIEELANKRPKSQKRGPHTLTVINPNVRHHLGLPILQMKTELLHYRVPDPYGRGYALYKREYLCLYEVTPQEVVGKWDWDDLLHEKNWYQAIILPAFTEHDKKFQAAKAGLMDMAILQDALPRLETSGSLEVEAGSSEDYDKV
ncbi:hypothetical protein BJX76DRAFT_353256 [Aspergillus varians]